MEAGEIAPSRSRRPDTEGEESAARRGAAIPLSRLTAAANRWALAAVLGLAALVRLPTLGHQSFWLDESATRDVISLPLSEALRRVPQHESTPPLYYVAAWGWAHLFGSGDAALRSLSALCGIAFVWVAYLYGRRLAGRGCGLALAALSSVHPWLVWYSQEARAYAPAALLAALGWLAFLAVLDRPDPRRVMWWALASGLAATTHYTAAFFAIAQGAWLFWARPRAREAIVLSAGGLAVLGLALSTTAAMQNDGRGAWIHAQVLGDRLEGAVREALAGAVFPTWHPALWVGIVATAGAALALRRPDVRRVFAPALLALGAVVLLLVLREAGTDIVFGRNLIFGWLPAAAVVAAGLTALPRPWMSAAAVAAACGLLLAITVSVQVDDRLQKPDWRRVAHDIGPAGEIRLVLASGGWSGLALGHYLHASEANTHPRLQTREVVAVAPRTASFVRGCGAGALCGMAPLIPGPSPVPGLVRASERTIAGGRFLLVRYVAPRPVTIDTAAAAGFGLVQPGDPVIAFVQRPDDG